MILIKNILKKKLQLFDSLELNIMQRFNFESSKKCLFLEHIQDEFEHI